MEKRMRATKHNITKNQEDYIVRSGAGMLTLLKHSIYDSGLSERIVLEYHIAHLCRELSDIAGVEVLANLLHDLAIRNEARLLPDNKYRAMMNSPQFLDFENEFVEKQQELGWSWPPYPSAPKPRQSHWTIATLLEAASKAARGKEREARVAA